MDILKHEFNRIPYKRFGVGFPFRSKMTGKIIDFLIFLEAIDHALRQFLGKFLRESFRQLFIRRKDELRRLHAVNLVHQKIFPIRAGCFVPTGLPCGYIGKTKDGPSITYRNSRQVLIVLVIKDGIGKDRSRRQDLCDFPLDNPDCFLGIFHLVANGNAIALLDEFGQVAVN